MKTKQAKQMSVVLMHRSWVDLHVIKIFRVYLLPTENGGPSKAASEDP